MRFANVETPTFSGSAGSGSGANSAPSVAERMNLYDRSGNVIGYFDKTVAGVVSMSLNGNTVFAPASVPEIAATPTAQGIVDALVTLGLVTQAEA